MGDAKIGIYNNSCHEVGFSDESLVVLPADLWPAVVKLDGRFCISAAFT